MTDIEWGAEIAVNSVRPEWLRGKEAMNWRSCDDRKWYGADSSGYTDEEWVDPIHYIRLHATHPYYIATSRGFTYWPGGESAPDDWDGGECLMRNGATTEPSWWTREEPRSYDIIGYRKRTEQPAPVIAPELVERMVALVAYMATGAESILEQYHPNTGLGMAYTEAKAINDALRPEDPDLTLAKSIVGDAEAIALAIKAARENGRG